MTASDHPSGATWPCPVCDGEGAVKEVLVGEEHLVLEPAAYADEDSKLCDTCHGMGQLDLLREDK